MTTTELDKVNILRLVIWVYLFAALRHEPDGSIPPEEA
jgi:hypothetical protein